MATKKSEVPAGFALVDGTTKVSGIEFPCQYLQADDLGAYRAAWEAKGHDPDEVLLGLVNAAQKQNATQSPKEGIRDVLRKDDHTQADVDEAIGKAQESMRTFITGAPRERVGGMTKTAARTKGEAVLRAQAAKGEALTPEEMFEIWNNPDLAD